MYIYARREWCCLTRFVQSPCACWDLTRKLDLFSKVVLLQLVRGRIIGIALGTVSILQSSISSPYVLRIPLGSP